jgi:hypothetical protein
MQMLGAAKSFIIIKNGILTGNIGFAVSALYRVVTGYTFLRCGLFQALHDASGYKKNNNNQNNN